MNAVSAVLAVSGARWNAAVYRVASTRRPSSAKSTQATKASGNVRPSSAPTSAPAQNAPALGSPNLPLGLLESVAQPAASNAQAGLDYHDLRTALDSGNLAAAQQAYLRMQSDLLVDNSTQANTGANLNLAV